MSTACTMPSSSINNSIINNNIINTNNNSTLIKNQDYKRPAEIIAKAFQTLRINEYITQNAPYEENLDEVEHRIKQLINCGCDIIMDPNSASAAAWIPPHIQYPPYEGDLTPEYQWLEDEIARCSKKFMKGRPHWNLTLLGKDPERNDIKGSTSMIVKPFMKRALEIDHVPVVLEAIDERARDIYLHYGFKIYEIIEVGEGLKAYYMVYNNVYDTN